MRTKPKGITFLLAVIVSALALSLSLGISFILLEEFKLARYNKNSFNAFFAADSGGDCALYWDLQQNAFMNPIDSINSLASDLPGPFHVDIICMGQTLTISDLTVTENLFGPNQGTTTEFSLNSPNTFVTVTVAKIGRRTIITSLGKNISCVATAKPGTVQRGIEITY